MNRLNPQGIAFIAGVIILGTCWAGGQTAVLREAPIAQKPRAAVSASDAVVHKGLFTIDAAVTDAAGSPVSDLSAWDLTLLDNGQPAKIRTFSNSLAPSEPPPELIFVLDEVNLSAEQLTQTKSSISHFLLRNNGHLEIPCFLYRLTGDGLYSSLRPSTDGALLAAELEETRPLQTVWRVDLASWESGLTPNRLSVRALGTIAISQRDVPATKSWCGPVRAGL